MVDPLAEVVSLLQPNASYSKHVSGAGNWRVRRAENGRPFYCAILEGACRLTAAGNEPLTLQQGDFVLIPAAYDFATSSLASLPDDTATAPVEVGPRQFRVGRQSGPVDVRILIGYCDFGSADADLLVSLLPELVHVQGESRMTTLVQLVDEEARGLRPAREIILAHLLEVLFIEALRSVRGSALSPGLVRGLGDDRLGCRPQATARPTHRALDRGATGQGGRLVAFRVLRAVPSRPRGCADGVSAGLAHGSGQEPVAPKGRGIGGSG